MSDRPVLVTGGAGFIGCNVADRLAGDGRRVVVLDALLRPGVADNAAWLKARHPDRVTVVEADIRDEAVLRELAADASAVLHFAAQVAVTTSMADPALDFSINLVGTTLLLETLRGLGRPVPLLFASTNKVYGDLADIPLVREDDRWQPQDASLRARGIAEDRRLDFHTPYGCSKGAADQYVLDYARSFGMPAAVLRMSCVYGPRQMGTEDQGWVAHFLIRALAGETLSIYGDGAQVRDVLYVDDAVEAYLRVLAGIDRFSGTAFNLGGGPRNAISLLQLIRHIEALTGRPVDAAFFPARPGDQRYYVSDIASVTRACGLAPPVEWRDGVARLLEHLSARFPVKAAAGAVPAIAESVA